MRPSLLIMMVGLAGSFASAQSHEVQLRKGATEAGDGFYLRITAQSQAAMPSRPREWPPSTIWFKFKIPHKLDEDTASECVVQIVDWRGQPIATLRDSPYQTDEAHNEDAFDIIAVPQMAKKMQLCIEYVGKAEWGGRIITRQYNLKLRDYMSLVK